MAKVTADTLTKEIDKLLEEYTNDVAKNVAEVTEKVAKLGVSALKDSSKSKFGGSGKYASGWRANVEKGRLSTKAVLYNAKMPGLPHLLEFGHANRGGGRTPGRVHIAPIETQLEKAFEEQLERIMS